MWSFSAQDVYVAVMGVSGAGKSTFISHCVDHPVESSSRRLRVYDGNRVSGANLKLVCVPHIELTDRSDSNIVQEVADWLSAAFLHHVELCGIIYLHRINDRGICEEAQCSLNWFMDLCGDSPANRIVLATTGWETSGDWSDQVSKLAKEAELADPREFWGGMIGKGCRIERHTNEKESAARLLSALGVSVCYTPNFGAVRQRTVKQHPLSGMPGVTILTPEQVKRFKDRARQRRREKATSSPRDQDIAGKSEIAIAYAQAQASANNKGVVVWYTQAHNATDQKNIATSYSQSQTFTGNSAHESSRQHNGNVFGGYTHIETTYNMFLPYYPCRQPLQMRDVVDRDDAGRRIVHLER